MTGWAAGGGFSVSQSLLRGQEGWIVASYGLSGGTPGAFVSYSYGFSTLRTTLLQTITRLQALPRQVARNTGS